MSEGGDEVSVAVDNSVWSVDQDASLMSWATQQPGDWQVGGRCHVYMWGSGRHGQLAETGVCHGFQNLPSKRKDYHAQLILLVHTYSLFLLNP